MAIPDSAPRVPLDQMPILGESESRADKQAKQSRQRIAKQAKQSRQRIANLRNLFVWQGAGAAWPPNYDRSGDFDRVRANLIATVADWQKIGNPPPSRAAAIAIVAQLQATNWEAV